MQGVQLIVHVGNPTKGTICEWLKWEIQVQQGGGAAVQLSQVSVTIYFVPSGSNEARTKARTGACTEACTGARTEACTETEARQEGVRQEGVRQEGVRQEGAGKKEKEARAITSSTGAGGQTL